MIHFTIKFLICFTKPKEPVKKENVGKKKKIQPSNKKDKKLKSPALEGIQDNLHTEEDNKYTVKCLDKAREWCHIEYCLLEGVLPKIELNIVTWGEAAKVYTEDNCRAVKTVTINDNVWVFFTVAHKILDLENDEILQFKDNPIKFKVSQDQLKMMANAVDDWPREFHFCKIPSDPQNCCDAWFHELCQTDPPDETYTEVQKEQMENYKIMRPGKNTILSSLIVFPYEKKVKTKIHNIMTSLSLIRKSQDLPTKKGRIKEKSKMKENKTDGKKDKNANQDFDDKFILVLKTHPLIAGIVDVCSEKTDITSTLKYTGVLATATNILTDEQNLDFVPLIVTIKNIKGLPITFIEKFKLKNIFARYELANIMNDVETIKVPLREDVSIDDTRVFFISSENERKRQQQLMLRPSVLTLAEALLTRRFVVKLYGDIDVVEPEITPCLFGDNSTDHFLSNPDHEMFTEFKEAPILTEVFLGSACFSLINLIKGFSIVETSAVVTSAPVSTWAPVCDVEDIMDHSETESEGANILNLFIQKGKITETLLLQHSTRVKVKVSTFCKLSNLTDFQLIFMPVVFHRLIVIFQDNIHANNVIRRITQANVKLGNAKTGSLSSSSFSSLLKSPRESLPGPQMNSTSLNRISSIAYQMRDLRRAMSSSQRNMTGFFIESDKECILVLEAVPDIFPLAMEPLHGISPSDVRVIYDSSLFFTKKLYSDFYPLSVFSIRLSEPLDVLLKQSSNYIRKEPPEAAIQTLLLLDLLRRTRTLHGACINQLFPSCNQLTSFNSTFGSVKTVSTTGSFSSMTPNT